MTTLELGITNRKATQPSSITTTAFVRSIIISGDAINIAMSLKQFGLSVGRSVIYPR